MTTLLWLHHFARFSIALKFEPRDLWVGLYWDHTNDAHGKWLEIYICIIPTLPIHIVIERNREE